MAPSTTSEESAARTTGFSAALREKKKSKALLNMFGFFPASPMTKGAACWRGPVSAALWSPPTTSSTSVEKSDVRHFQTFVPPISVASFLLRLRPDGPGESVGLTGSRSRVGGPHGAESTAFRAQSQARHLHVHAWPALASGHLRSEASVQPGSRQAAVLQAAAHFR